MVVAAELLGAYVTNWATVTVR